MAEDQPYRGRIAKVFANKKGDKKFWVLSIAGANYSVWDEGLMRGVEEGNWVEGEYSQNRQFRNVMTLYKTDPPETEGPPENPVLTNVTSLKYAGLTTQHADLEPLTKARLTVEIAEVYRAYIRGENYRELLGDMDREPRIQRVDHALAHCSGHDLGDQEQRRLTAQVVIGHLDHRPKED